MWTKTMRYKQRQWDVNKDNETKMCEQRQWDVNKDNAM